MTARHSLRIPEQDAPRIRQVFRETCDWLSYVALWQDSRPVVEFPSAFLQKWNGEPVDSAFRSPLAAPSHWLCNWGERADWKPELAAMQQTRRTRLSQHPEITRNEPATQECAAPTLWALLLGPTMAEGLFCQQSNGYFDPYDLPPWDTWVEYYPGLDPDRDSLLFVLPAEHHPRIKPLLCELDTYDFFCTVECSGL